MPRPRTKPAVVFSGEFHGTFFAHFRQSPVIKFFKKTLANGGFRAKTSPTRFLSIYQNDARSATCSPSALSVTVGRAHSPGAEVKECRHGSSASMWQGRRSPRAVR